MNDTYLQILEHLEQWGIDREVDISSLLYELFTHQINVDPYEPFDSVNARIERFLDVMHENRHITQARQKIRVEGQPDKWQVQARLTYLGMQYCITMRQIQLDQTIANNSTIQARASLRQTNIFRWTAVFAFGAMGISGISLFRDIHKDKMSEQLSQKDSLIHTLQKKVIHLKNDSTHLSEELKKLTKK